MSKINDKDLKYFIREFLFENQINEKFQPDSGTRQHVNYDLYNRPGPQIDDSGNPMDQDTAFEIEEIMPVSPSDIMVDPNFLKVVHNIEDKNYSPANKKEFRSAILTLIDRCEDLESQNKIEKTWSSFKVILDKVCNK